MKNIKNQEQISSSIRKTITNLEKKTKKYLSKIDVGSAFSFGDDEENRKRHFGIYNKFNLSVKTHMENCEQEISLLSVLICEADKSCDENLTKELSQKFDLYLQFSASVSRFTKNCEAVFLDKENKFRPLLIANYVKELLAATQNYKQNI